MKIVNNQKGFTLIEVMISLLISGIVMISIYSVFQSQQDSYVAQDQVAEMQQNIRAGVDMMLREIRMAGYDPDDLGTAGITIATPTSVTFTLVADDDGVDNNSDGKIDESGELKTIQYDLYDAYGDGDTDLGRQIGATATSKRPLAENIDNLEFRYLDSSGNPTAVLNNIRSIQLSILARADRPDRKILNTLSNTAKSGAVWGPYNDNFRRRISTTTVKCRNLGL